MKTLILAAGLLAGIIGAIPVVAHACQTWSCSTFGGNTTCTCVVR